MAHISTHPAGHIDPRYTGAERQDLGWRLRMSGRLVELAFVDQGRRQVGGGTRGKVRLWTRQSRVRLLKRCAVVPWDALGELVFITLTYPRDFPTDGQEVKKHMKRFERRWFRKFGQAVGVWKLEFQARGAPHVHLAVRKPPGEKWEVRDWVRLAWAASVATEDEEERRKHENAGTQIDRWRASPRHVASYLGGYCFGKSKEYQHNVPAELVNVGRWWGTWGMSKRETGLRPQFEGTEVAPEVAFFVRRVLQDVHRAAVGKRRGCKPGRRPLPADQGAWAIGGAEAGGLAAQMGMAVERFLNGGGSSSYIETFEV